MSGRHLQPTYSIFKNEHPRLGRLSIRPVNRSHGASSQFSRLERWLQRAVMDDLEFMAPALFRGATLFGSRRSLLLLLPFQKRHPSRLNFWHSVIRCEACLHGFSPDQGRFRAQPRDGSALQRPRAPSLRQNPSPLLPMGTLLPRKSYLRGEGSTPCCSHPFKERLLRLPAEYVSTLHRKPSAPPADFCSTTPTRGRIHGKKVPRQPSSQARRWTLPKGKAQPANCPASEAASLLTSAAPRW